MNNNSVYKKKYISILLVIVLISLFSWKFGALYTSLGLCILTSWFILLFEEKINKFDKKNREIMGLLISGALGAFFFITVLSPKVLNTSSINWLLSRGDPSQHFLGWHFFRNDPWTLPMGVIESLNVPIGTTITYTDSIPLFAFVFKVFNPILPDIFQYLGLWILLCYILQGVFGLLLMKKITRNLGLQILGLMFFIMSPIMLFRAYGHEALMAQWLILCAIYLYMSSYKHIKWLFLLFISLIVHPYLFIMCFIIFSFKLLEYMITSKVEVRKMILYFLSAVFLILVTLWSIGYFYIGSSGSSDGFGIYSMNINSIFNPHGWSQYLLKDQPLANSGQGEGFNYLGVGVILLLVWSFYILINYRKFNFKKNLVLIFISILFTLIALSNVITFSDRLLLEIPLPTLVLKLFGIVRASGRFFWPVYYLIILFCLFSVIKNTKTKTAAILLTVALSLQFADSSGKFYEFHNLYESESKWETPLQSEIWNEIDGDKYHNIVFVPSNVNDKYVAFSMLAAEKNMTLNAFYTARDDIKKREAYNKELIKDFEQGKWNTESIYIVDNSLFRNTMIKKNENDLFLSVDGFNLLIPNGLDNPELKELSIDLDTFDVNYKYGDVINFGADGNSQLLKGYGWSNTEQDATWTEGKEANLIFSLTKPEKDLVLSMKMAPLLGGDIKDQNLIISANNHEIKNVEIKSKDTYQFIIPKDIVNNQLEITLSLPDAISPKELGLNEDERVLGLYVESLNLNEIKP